jgi:hypothetical protein
LRKEERREEGKKGRRKIKGRRNGGKERKYLSLWLFVLQVTLPYPLRNKPGLDCKYGRVSGFILVLFSSRLTVSTVTLP